MNPLKTLITKLNDKSRQALEQSANICMQRAHYNIEIEHWLSVLLEDTDSSLVYILLQAQCNLDKVKQDINHSLEKLKTGNDQAPAISNRVIDWINQAWLTTSLDYQGQQIDSGILLYALFNDQILTQITHAISGEFDKLDSDLIKQLMAQSREDNSQEEVIENTSMSSKALSQFTINLNEQAKAGKIDQVIGREDEIRQMIDVLSRRRQNNVILTGDPGVGKTAIVEGLALKIVNNDVPDILSNVVIHSLDMGLLQAGASVKGEFENRLKSLISQIKSSTAPILLFIDEAHSMIGAGGQSGQNDAANLLKPALARGELSCIAATTWAEYKLYFEKDAALTRRFQVVKIEEPSIENAIKMLRALAPSLEKHHQVTILDAAITQATALAERYISGRQLPDKSISVLDTACSRVAGKLKATPVLVEKHKKSIALLTDEVNRLKQEEKQGISHSKINKKLKEIDKINNKLEKLEKQWQAEKELVENIILLREQGLQQEGMDKKQFNQLYKTLQKTQKDKPLLQPFVDDMVVAEVIADWTGIPVGNMVKDEAEQILQMKEDINKKIIGQDQALDTICNAVKTASLKLTDSNKPLGVFLLVGPSGVGKTETAITLAEQVFGSREKMTVINMSEFKEEHKISMLAGSPPGYVGYGEGGVLTEAVRRKPYSLILLDEMEKAHTGIQDVFYQVFDKGVLKDGQGRDIDFKNTLIVMTSNACSDLLTKTCVGSEQKPNLPDISKAIESELLKTFKPAFIGRVNVVPYMPLDKIALRNIVRLKLDIIKDRFNHQHSVELTFSNNYINYLESCANQHIIGARLIDNLINAQLLPVLSDLFLEQMLNKKRLTKLTVDFTEQQKFSFDIRTAKNG